MNGRAWTDAEVEAVRSRYGEAKAPELARSLGRSARAVHLKARSLGLAKAKAVVDGAFLAELRRLNALGRCDTDVATALGAERHTVARHRKALGLPSHARGEVFRRRIAAAARRQCERAGVKSVGELRGEVWRAKARALGWPDDLRWPEVLILETLATRGPLSRPQLADAVGVRWNGSRRTFKCKSPGGSYLAHLVRRGLIVRLGKVVRGKGKGHSVNLYSLAFTTERSPGHGDAETAPESDVPPAPPRRAGRRLAGPDAVRDVRGAR
jgi:hypothetical protein